MFVLALLHAETASADGYGFEAVSVDGGAGREEARGERIRLARRAVRSRRRATWGSMPTNDGGASITARRALTGQPVAQKDAAAHDHGHFRLVSLKDRNVLQRIGVQHDDIGHGFGGDAPEDTGPLRDFRIHGGCGSQDVDRTIDIGAVTEWRTRRLNRWKRRRDLVTTFRRVRQVPRNTRQFCAVDFASQALGIERADRRKARASVRQRCDVQAHPLRDVVPGATRRDMRGVFV